MAKPDANAQRHELVEADTAVILRSGTLVPEKVLKLQKEQLNWLNYMDLSSRLIKLL